MRTVAAAATALLLATPAQAAEPPPDWEDFKLERLQPIGEDGLITAPAALEVQVGELREGWEKWNRDWNRHVAYIQAIQEQERSESIAASSPPATEPVATPVSSGVDWYAIAECESDLDWTIDSTYDGGLQFHPGTWISAGGGAYAPYAYLASPAEQIAVAQAWANEVGCVHCSAGWPVCGAYGI